MEIEVLSTELAKNVFQLHGIERRGCAIYKRRVFRDQLLSVIGNIPPCTIVIEACTEPSIGPANLRRSVTG